MEKDNYLLDTQVALWLFLDDPKLQENKFRERFVNNKNNFIFHQISIWEIQIKYDLGKLKLPKRPELLLPEAIELSGLEYFGIEDKGIFFLDKLPNIHGDPFDRLLISHASVNAWTVITADKNFEKYPIKVALI